MMQHDARRGGENGSPDCSFKGISLFLCALPFQAPKLAKIKVRTTLSVKESSHFFRATLTKIHQIKINHTCIWTQISIITPYQAHLKHTGCLESNVIDFNVAFSEHRSEGVISFFWRSVYTIYVTHVKCSPHWVCLRWESPLGVQPPISSNMTQPRFSGVWLGLSWAPHFQPISNTLIVALQRTLYNIKALFNSVFTLKNLSCMALHDISVFGIGVKNEALKKFVLQEHH